MKLSKNFSLSEFTDSETATRLGIENVPNAEQVDNAITLVKKVLQPLRTATRMGITINSGIRSEELNTAIKGAKNSQHMKGEAADITAGGRERNRRLFEWLKVHLQFDQLILYPTFIHVSYHEGSNRNQVIIK